MRINIGRYPKGNGDRRVSIKIHKYDTWNMDHTLAMIIHPMLLQLRKTRHGSPETDDTEVPDHLRKNIITTGFGEEDTNLHQRWEWILDEMIWAFGQKLIDWEDQYHSGVIDHRFQALDSQNQPIGTPGALGETEKSPEVVLYRMETGPKHTHVFDREGYDRHFERMQRGFSLFGKYYSNLWD